MEHLFFANEQHNQFIKELNTNKFILTVERKFKSQKYNRIDMITDETLAPVDWARDLHKVLLQKNQYIEMIKTFEDFINSTIDKSFTMVLLYRVSTIKRSKFLVISRSFTILYILQ